MQALYKNELARKAGVSVSTLRGWIRRLKPKLVRYGYKDSDHLLSPKMVEIISEYYSIEV